MFVIVVDNGSAESINDLDELASGVVSKPHCIAVAILDSGDKSADTTVKLPGAIRFSDAKFFLFWEME